MAKITRKTQKIFAGGAIASPTGVIAQFGSLAATAPQYSSDPDVIQALAAFTAGWTAALINAPDGNASPAMQDDNAIKYLVTRQLAYLFQDGMAEWDAGTTYFTDSFVKSGGAIFISKTDNNLGNAVTDTNNWKTLASTLLNTNGQAKAWVCFNGVGATIQSSFNVSGITKTATGCYILTFVNPMADDAYAFTGSAGVPAGFPTGPGDDNIITGGFSGRTSVKTTSQLSVFCSDPNARQLQDSQAISIVIFGN